MGPKVAKNRFYAPAAACADCKGSEIAWRVGGYLRMSRLQHLHVGGMTGAICRCTQNTAFMEEWRKGWHPEKARPKSVSDTVLVVGAGLAGLEVALQLGKRGYRVTHAEAGKTPGGRLSANVVCQVCPPAAASRIARPPRRPVVPA